MEKENPLVGILLVSLLSLALIGPLIFDMYKHRNSITQCEYEGVVLDIKKTQFLPVLVLKSEANNLTDLELLFEGGFSPPKIGDKVYLKFFKPKYSRYHQRINPHRMIQIKKLEKAKRYLKCKTIENYYK